MMRILAAIGLTLLGMINPTGIAVPVTSTTAPNHTVQGTDTATVSHVQLDLHNPFALTVNAPDFTTDVVKPAQAQLAAAQAAQLQAVTAKLQAAGLKPQFAEFYLQTAGQTGTPWQLLAAVHKVETNQSGTTFEASFAGAVGPMQFIPSTFAAYARDGDGDGIARINDVADAIATAGHYLAAGGAAAHNYVAALFNYNHTMSYVNYVLSIANRLGL